MYIFWMVVSVNFDFLIFQFVNFCAQYICFWRDTCCSTVNFLSAATLTSHILQKSIYPSVEKISLPNSDTNERKRALVEVLFLGIFNRKVLKTGQRSTTRYTRRSNTKLYYTKYSGYNTCYWKIIILLLTIIHYKYKYTTGSL